MKRAILAALAVGSLACLGIYANRARVQTGPPTQAIEETSPAPVAEQATATDEPAAAAPVPVTPPPPKEPAPKAAVTSSSAFATPTQAALASAELGQTVDVLVSKEVSHQQKREVWKKLREAGKLDQAITELEQRTAANPQSAEYPAALGQAYLQKCGMLQDLREQGILAMQADKLFETALNLDPYNWEARFTKAVAMSYWPPTMNKGDEVMQQFQTLIQQQEGQVQQPQFAESYAWLGDQYQKAGRTDDARAVWARGAALFPTDDKLRNKLAGAP